MLILPMCCSPNLYHPSKTHSPLPLLYMWKLFSSRPHPDGLGRRRRPGKTQTRYRGTPTDKPGPEQHSPLDRPTSTPGKKRNWLISNKNNKDTQERGWGTLSVEDWGKGILPRTINKQAGWAGEALVGAGVHTHQPGAGKLVRVAEGGKLHRRGGKTHFPCEL
jgi:hypothetical protein